MKSKLRTIVVDEITFYWNIRQVTPNYICLRIWAVDNKALPWAQIRYRFDDPWLHYGELLVAKEKATQFFQLRPLTPKTIAALIREVLKLNGPPTVFKTSLNYALVSDDVLIEIANALTVGEP